MKDEEYVAWALPVGQQACDGQLVIGRLSFQDVNLSSEICASPGLVSDGDAKAQFR